MRYISLFLILSLMCAAHPGSAQLTIDFSSEEGFVDGPLHRQPNPERRWLERLAGSYQVDAEKGIITFDSSADNWSPATFSKGLTIGDVYIFAIDLQLTVGSPVLKNGNSLLNRFDFAGEDGIVSASIRQRGTAPNTFDLFIFDGVGPKPSNSLQSIGFSGEEIGLKVNGDGTGYKNGVSDPLRLIIVHRKTGEGSLFTSAVILENPETKEEIQKVVLPKWDATDSWLNEKGKTFRIMTGNMNEKIADDGRTSISIDTIKIGVAME